jgi:hypothetical protein
MDPILPYTGEDAFSSSGSTASTSSNDSEHEISASGSMDPIVTYANEYELSASESNVSASHNDSEHDLPAPGSTDPVVANVGEYEFSASPKVSKCECSTSGRALVVCIDGTANQFSKQVSP